MQTSAFSGEYLDNLSKELNISPEKLQEFKNKKIGINELSVLVEISKESGKSLDEIVQQSQAHGISKTVDDLGIKNDNFLKQVYERQNSLSQKLALPNSLPDLRPINKPNNGLPPGPNGPEMKMAQPDQKPQDLGLPIDKNKGINNQNFKTEMRAEFKLNNFTIWAQ